MASAQICLIVGSSGKDITAFTGLDVPGPNLSGSSSSSLTSLVPRDEIFSALKILIFLKLFENSIFAEKCLPSS